MEASSEWVTGKVGTWILFNCSTTVHISWKDMN